jgi:hypothetical protein
MSKRWIALLAVLAGTVGVAHADLESDTPDVAQFEGTYAASDLTNPACATAQKVTFSEDSDPATGQPIYHLSLLNSNGRVWSSREYRQLNGEPWFKADAGNDGTVTGRSRYACKQTGCMLWNERKTCSGMILPLCSGWQSNRQDTVIFDGDAITLYVSGSSRSCRFVR